MALRYPSHKLAYMERYVAESTTATSGGTLALTDRVLVRLALSGNGTIDLEAGSEDGQYRILLVETLTGSTRIENSTNVRLINRAWLPQDPGEAIAFLWNATLAKWVEVWRTEDYDSIVGMFAKNTTGTTLTAGTVVYINGNAGSNPTVTRADMATEATSAGTVGLVHKDIANNEFGYIIAFGTITNIQVQRSAGVAGVAGDPIYLGSSGAFLVGVANKPSAPNHIVKVGNVINGSTGSAGIIQVHISNGWEIEELHDVAITSKAKGDIIAYDSAAALWKNVAVGANGTVLTADNTIATGVKWAVAGGGGSPSIGGTITGGTAGSILFVDPAATIAEDNTNLYWDNANNELGITPQTAGAPSAKLEVNFRGTTAITDYVAEFKNSSTTPDAGRLLISQGSTVGLALQTQGTGGATYTGTFQWITRSTGATLSTPLTLNDGGSITLGANLNIPEIAAPATPSAGLNTLYSKVDKNLYYKNNSGTEYQLTPVGGGGGLIEPEVMARIAWKIF